MSVFNNKTIPTPFGTSHLSSPISTVPVDIYCKCLHCESCASQSSHKDFAIVRTDVFDNAEKSASEARRNPVLPEGEGNEEGDG